MSAARISGDSDFEQPASHLQKDVSDGNCGQGCYTGGRLQFPVRKQKNLSMTVRIFLYSLICLPLAGSFAFAQHDPQRNATRFVAAGQFDKADQELRKADADEPETHFVKMLSALGRNNVESAVDHAQTALERGLPFARLAAGPRKALAPLRATNTWKRWAEQHASLKLLHGPMLGDVTGDGVSIWLRIILCVD